MSSPKFPLKSDVVIDMASLAPDLYAADVGKFKDDAMSKVANIEKNVSDATGSAAKTATAVGSVSSLALTAVCGGKLPREMFDVTQKYVYNILCSVTVGSFVILVVYGYQYSRQKKNVAILVRESSRVADAIVADDSTLYRVNREAGNTSVISMLPNNTFVFMLPSILKMAIIFGVTFAVVALVGQIGNKIA